MIPEKTSIRAQILSRIQDVLQPLKAEGKVEKIARVQTLWLQESVTPALHLVPGDEVLLSEDTRGYHVQLAFACKLIFKTQDEAGANADMLVAWLQEKLESDPQLNGTAEGTSLAICVKYQGQFGDPDELMSPNCVTVANYFVEYRRYRANPNRNY